MIRIAVVALLLILAIGPAKASEISQSLLDAEQAQCSTICSQEHGESKCASYCTCVMDRIRTEITLEEYRPIAMAMANGQEADSNSMTKLSDISTACERDSFQ